MSTSQRLLAAAPRTRRLAAALLLRPPPEVLQALCGQVSDVSAIKVFASDVSATSERQSRSATKGRSLGPDASPTNSSASPLEMLRRKVRTEKMRRVVEARSSIKKRLHDYTASCAFKALSGPEQAAFWIGSSRGPPNLSEQYANASKEYMLLSAGDAEFARLTAMPEGGIPEEEPHTAPPADSKGGDGKPWAFGREDLFRIGVGW
eukprot:CAMPEP_0180148202 /NCGR_PEP_ID=MMETSP0986-20121125/19824_1 /TAXON_ID=697907 /ORGANISM="non described non described, Strain CCMP2293" /LENGTH=205 /DNA_ID=CAMNT_0022094123 /DNA_START=203 /DNA_END=821 /DNA_ORIENTATION=+